MLELSTPRRHRPARHVHPLLARAARDPSVTIADFQFSPGTITVHVGDTVTWANNGPSSHTATASDGSFNTGVLQRGASASHTFTQAGSFSYFCQIHHFMHGTIVVLAAATTPAKTSQTTTTSATTPTTAGSSTATLPKTGLNLAGALAVGFGLAALGLGLRRFVGDRRSRT